MATNTRKNSVQRSGQWGTLSRKKVKKRAKLDTKSINFFSVVIIIIIISRCNKLNFYNDEKKTLCKA
jgi:hypothetical protein